MKKIQFGSELIIPYKNEKGSTVLKYCLLESHVGFGNNKLKSYGIEIIKTDRTHGMRDICECKQIEGIFFDIEEAIGFIAQIKKNAVCPTQLSDTLEEYISNKLKIQREKYKSNNATV